MSLGQTLTRKLARIVSNGVGTGEYSGKDEFDAIKANGVYLRPDVYRVGDHVFHLDGSTYSGPGIGYAGTWTDWLKRRGDYVRESVKYMMENNTVQNLVSAITTKDYATAKDQFTSLISGRATAILDRIKKVEATQLFVKKA